MAELVKTVTVNSDVSELVVENNLNNTFPLKIAIPLLTLTEWWRLPFFTKYSLNLN